MSDSQSKKYRGSRKQFRDGDEEKDVSIPLSVLKAEAQDIIKRFFKSGALHTTLDSMSREKRKVVHEVAQSNGLVTRSTGKEPDRYIILSHRENKLTRSSFVTTNPISPSAESLSKLSRFLAENPTTEIEMKEFLIEQSAKQNHSKKESFRNQNGVPPIPKCSKELQKTKDSLPASKYRQQVLSAIEKNDVVIISGGTGCGKTTQVPQFILEEAAKNKQNVRIMVTQPRRIAAISISERVAKERGERLGETVGYQIRLESRTSPRTLLTYCTTGVLLRMLTSDPTASGITHIIMDEIHEREINTDYLLIALRECIKKRKDLKVVLMSATIEGNMQLFSRYFQDQNIEVIRIEARTFDVKVFYIDQILAMSGYQPPESQVFFSASDFEPKDWEEELKAIREEKHDGLKNKNGLSENGTKLVYKDSTFTDTTVPLVNSRPIRRDSQCYGMSPNPRSTVPDSEPYSNNETVPEMWSSGLYNTQEGEVIEERTMLQFMSSVGCPEIRPITVEFCPNSHDSVFVNGVRYTADPNQPSEVLQKQFTDRALTSEHPHVYCCNPLNSKVPIQTEATRLPQRVGSNSQPSFSVPSPAAVSEKTFTPSTPAGGLAKFSVEEFGGFGEKQRLANMLEQKFRLELKSALPDRTVYYHPHMDELVQRVDLKKLRFTEKYEMFYGCDYQDSLDHNLLDHVIKYLADSPVFGTILVFLPGFDDIQLMMGKIDIWRNSLTNIKNVLVIPLHSQMHSINHANIFKPVNQGMRKIILATNIAEASITIEDVIFVVDTGKVKEKWYDHEAKLSTLAVKSIARSNAEQRSGRAGRVAKGYCIRLYSEETFNAMPETQIAEMKRAAIYDVTLHAKLFAPDNMTISEFLALAPEPPAKKSIIQSMNFLEQLGAFYRPCQNFHESYNESEDDGNREQRDPELTVLGRLMARLPLDPQLSRMLLFGLTLKCLAPIVNLVALLASREPYVLAQSDEREQQSKMKFMMAEQDFSDHLMYIRLCTAFCAKSSPKEQNDFCREHFLNFNTMKMVNGTRHQLLKELSRAKVVDVAEKDVMTLLFDPNYNAHSNSWTMVQAAIAAGCYPSVGVSTVDSNLKKVQTLNDRSAKLHASSILKKQIGKLHKNLPDGPHLEYVVFQEMCLMSSDQSLSIKTVTAIPGLTALLFTGPLRLSQQINEDYGIISTKDENLEHEEKPHGFGCNISTLNLDEWYSVRASIKTMQNCLRLRHKLMQFFFNGIAKSQCFGTGTTSSQKKMLEIIRELLDEAHLSHRFSPVDMPVTKSKAFSYSHRHTEVSKKEALDKRQNTRPDSNFQKSSASNHRGQWSRNPQYNITHLMLSHQDPSVLNNFPPNDNLVNKKNYETLCSSNTKELMKEHSLKVSSGEQFSNHHHNQHWSMNTRLDQSNRSSKEYGCGRQGKMGAVGNPSENVEKLNHTFPELKQKSTTSMGGFAPRGARGGNSSRMHHYNGRGGANNTSNNYRTN